MLDDSNEVETYLTQELVKRNLKVEFLRHRSLKDAETNFVERIKPDSTIFPCIIVDMHLPESRMGGESFIQFARAKGYGGPILIVTGYFRGELSPLLFAGKSCREETEGLYRNCFYFHKDEASLNELVDFIVELCTNPPFLTKEELDKIREEIEPTNKQMVIAYYQDIVNTFSIFSNTLQAYYEGKKDVFDDESIADFFSYWQQHLHRVKIKYEQMCSIVRKKSCRLKYRTCFSTLIRMRILSFTSGKSRYIGS
jgi:hypothetical protein